MWGRRGKVVGALLRASRAGGISSLILCLFVTAASAQSVQPKTEIFTGVEASDNYASGYVGAGTALGKGLYEPGFMLRAVGSFGRCHYDGTLLTDGAYVPTTFDGEDAFLDPNNAVQGSEIGLRLATETWLDISPRLFVSANASYGTAFQEYCALARVGFRVRPRLALGVEGGTLGNEEYNAGKGGGFVRLDVRNIEFTLSGGFTGNDLEDQPSSYVALGVYRPF
jgi:hypothetical protein